MNSLAKKKSMSATDIVEVNNAFRKELQEKGMNIVGTSPDNHIVEMIEIAGHPFYVGIRPIRNSNPARIMHILYSEDSSRRPSIRK